MQNHARGRNGGLLCSSYGWRGALACVSLIALTAFAAPAQAVETKPFTPPVTTAPPKGAHVNLAADMLTYDPRSNIGTARGRVHMTYGPYVLDATFVSFNRKTGEFKANGHIVIHEPNGNVLLADTMDMKNRFADGLMTRITALLTNDATLTAGVMRRVHGSTIIFESATYTACKDCRTKSGAPMWEIDSERTTYDPVHHNLYHIHPRLMIAGHQIIRLPYLNMPDPSVTRRTGFLLPDIKGGSAYGFGLVTPYFWALSPSTDLTFRPVWTTKQGPVADVEWRQATETGSYNIRGMGVYQFNDQPYPDHGPARGAIETAGNFKAGPDWSYGWDVTLPTDTNFLSSYGYVGRTYAVNDTYVTGLWDQTYISAKMMNFGSLVNTLDPNSLPYAMPFVTGETIMRDTPIGGEFDLSWNAYSLHRNTTLTPFNTVNQGLDQTRATAALDWHRAFYNSIGTVFTPFANLRGDMIVSNQVPNAASSSGFSSDTFARALPEAGFDLRWPFVSSTAFGQSIISPVVQVVASANEGDRSAFGNEDAITLNYDHSSIFLADRFTGLDRYEGGTHADVGLTYALYGNNGGLVRASLGQSIHIAGQNSFTDGSGLADNYSDFVGAIVYQPFSNFSLSYEGRLRNDFSAFNRQEVVASLDFDRFAANVSYLDFAPEPDYGQPNRVNWAAADGKIHLNDGWSVFGGVTYDFTTGIFARKVAGLEFDCKCMNFKVYYQGTQDTLTLTTDNRVMMSVELATIGKSGLGIGF